MVTPNSNRQRFPMLQDVQHLDAAKELIRSDEQQDFITVLNFFDPQEATDFAACIFKCRRHGLKEQELRFWLIAKARVAVKGRRSEMYSQAITRLLVPEFFGGKNTKGDNNNGDGNK